MTKTIRLFVLSKTAKKKKNMKCSSKILLQIIIYCNFLDGSWNSVNKPVGISNEHFCLLNGSRVIDLSRYYTDRQR